MSFDDKPKIFYSISIASLILFVHFFFCLLEPFETLIDFSLHSSVIPLMKVTCLSVQRKCYRWQHVIRFRCVQKSMPKKIKMLLKKKKAKSCSKKKTGEITSLTHFLYCTMSDIMVVNFRSKDDMYRNVVN